MAKYLPTFEERSKGGKKNKKIFDVVVTPLAITNIQKNRVDQIVAELKDINESIEPDINKRMNRSKLVRYILKQFFNKKNINVKKIYKEINKYENDKDLNF